MPSAVPPGQHITRNAARRHVSGIAGSHENRFGARSHSARQTSLPPNKFLVEPQRIPAVIVIAAVPAELLVALLAVACDGGVVGLVDFEPHGVASALARRPLGGPEQLFGNPLPAHVTRYGARVVPRPCTAWTVSQEGEH